MKQASKKGVYTKRKRLNSWRLASCSISHQSQVSAGILGIPLPADIRAASRSLPGCSSGAAGLRSPHRSINTSLINGSSSKQMKLARRTSPCVACGAPIVVDTPIAPLLGQNGRIRLCINRPFHLRGRYRAGIASMAWRTTRFSTTRREILIYAQAYGGCMPRARRRRHNRALIGSAAAYVTWAITAPSRIRL